MEVVIQLTYLDRRTEEWYGRYNHRIFEVKEFSNGYEILNLLDTIFYEDAKH